MEDALKTLAGRVQGESRAFLEFFTAEVAKIEAAAAAGNVRELCEREKVLCAGLGSARERILGHYEGITEFLPTDVRVIDAEITDLMRKEHQRLLKKKGVLRTSPVVGTMGYSKTDRLEVINKVLDLGGAFTHKLARNSLTHVIASQDALRHDTRVNALRTWGVHVVPIEWLNASVTHKTWVTTEGHESQDSPDIGGVQPGGLKEEVVEANGDNFLMAVERLCEDTQEAESESQVIDNEALFSSDKSSHHHQQQTRKRVSRAELLNGSNDPSPNPQPAKKQRAMPGSANTIGREQVKKVANPNMERMPANVIPPGHPSLPTTNGVESQVIRWDNNPSGNDEKKMREKVLVKTFQLAGGGSVPKTKLHELVKMIQSLNGEVELVPKYVNNSTHLLALCETQQLTEKYLSFVAAGKWIVKEAYITASVKAGCWLDEEDFMTDSPGRPIAYHRANFGGAFKSWKVILLLESGGISVILRAGGCPEIWTAITPETAAQATHILTDTPGKDLVIPKPTGVEPAALTRLSKITFSIEILYKILCVTIDEAAAKQSCALNVSFA